MRKCENMSIWLSIAMVLICVMCSTVRASAEAPDMTGKSEKELRTYANENKTWAVCYQQGNRTSNFHQYDATNECLYFSYSKQSCVDVYDINGTFLYSFIFPDRQNGGVSVRCENNQIYISTKDNILYIFEGIEEIDHMDYDEASRKGYDFFWFYNNSPHITVDKKYINWHDDSGEVVKQISTPAVIAKSIPDSGSTLILKMLFAVLLGLVFIFIGFSVKKRDSDRELPLIWGA